MAGMVNDHRWPAVTFNTSSIPAQPARIVYRAGVEQIFAEQRKTMVIPFDNHHATAAGRIGEFHLCSDWKNFSYACILLQNQYRLRKCCFHQRRGYARWGPYSGKVTLILNFGDYWRGNSLEHRRGRMNRGRLLGGENESSRDRSGAHGRNRH